MGRFSPLLRQPQADSQYSRSPHNRRYISTGNVSFVPIVVLGR